MHFCVLTDNEERWSGLKNQCCVPFDLLFISTYVHTLILRVKYPMNAYVSVDLSLLSGWISNYVTFGTRSYYILQIRTNQFIFLFKT